jgi:hypothetical protein
MPLNFFFHLFSVKINKSVCILFRPSLIFNGKAISLSEKGAAMWDIQVGS